MTAQRVEKRRSAQLLSYSLAFTATGIGCALPGAMLPVLLRAWHWSDSAAGWFFLVLALSSALAPLLLPRRRSLAIAGAFLLIAVAALAWRVALLPQVFAALWGLGLGLAMTGISLQTYASVPHAERQLLRLNLLWSVGATTAPIVVARALRVSSPEFLLMSVALMAGSLCALLLWTQAAHTSSAGNIEHEARRTKAWVPVSLIAATVLPPSIESAANNWLATFADRSFHLLRFTVAAPLLFWLGLLGSRLLSSLGQSRKQVHTQHVRGYLLCALLGIILLLIAQQQWTLVTGSALLGFGLGPLYPVFLNRALTRGAGRGIFLMAGVGSGLLPWTTGTVSAAVGSLRAGLLVPLLCTLMMVAAGWVATSMNESQR